MKHITKFDNEKMVVTEKTITLYDNIIEVLVDSGMEAHVESIQYEADMYVVKNKGITDFETLLAQAKETYISELATDVRKRRNTLLDKADIIVNKADDSGNTEMIAKARAYRQSLRDIPEQDGFPENVVWPVL